MQFLSRDLTDQYISESYQNVVQQYPTGSLFYLLDGLGNVIAVLNSSSVGDLLITSNMTASMAVASASYAVTYSFTDITIVSSSAASSSISASYSLSASYAPGTGGSGVTPGGSYNITTSYASSSMSSSVALTASNALYSQLSFESLFADTASYTISSVFADTASLAAEAISSSYALSASYAPGGSGTPIVSGSIYPITSSWAFNALTASYVAFVPSGSTESASYSITSSYASFTGNNGLSIPNYDYSNLTYTGPLGQVSDCTYKVGGSSGTIVCIITALYSGAVFIGVSKSFG